MADGMGWMDVQAMVEKAVQGEKWSRNRHIEDVEKDLRREFHREVMELREEVGELVAEVHKLIEHEKSSRRFNENVFSSALDVSAEDLV